MNSDLLNPTVWLPFKGNCQPHLEAFPHLSSSPLTVPPSCSNLQLPKALLSYHAINLSESEKKPRSHVRCCQVFKGLPVAVERAAAKGKSAPSFIISFSQTTRSGNLSGLGPTAFLAQPVLIRKGPLGLHQCLLMEGSCASLLSSHFETQTWPSFANEKGGSLGVPRC